MVNTLGIVITYKETELCKKAIKSLVDANIDVALVFNGWESRFEKWLDKMGKYIDFKFLNNKNLGFCKGNNMAMRLAIEKGYDYVFLLNNDAYIEPDCIDILVKIAERDGIGMVQPKVYKAYDKKILDSTGLIWKFGNHYSWESGLGYIIDRGQEEVDEGQYDSHRDVIGCCACSVLYKTEMLRKIGLFWEKLWSQEEDVELSWRAYKHGWKAKFVPEAVAYHWRGYTAKGKGTRDKLRIFWELVGYRNWVLTLRRHGNRKQRLFTSAMWGYVGCKSWVGMRIGRNVIGGYFIWLCSLALLNDYYFQKMESYFGKMLKNIV